MGNDYKKWLKATREAARAAGWTEKYAATHLKVFPPDTTLGHITLATTSNDPTTIRNQTARLRRAGLDI